MLEESGVRMGMFAYIARDPAGGRVAGTLAGASEQTVLAELHARDLVPVTVTAVRERRPLIRRRVSTRKLANLYRQLADLLRSGVPLLRSLRVLGRSSFDPHLAKVVNDVAGSVADGERLADAMTLKTDVFPDVHIAMIRAGETGGFLEQVLARLGDFLEHQADMKSKVIGNLIYPAILLSLAFIIVVGALVFFVPRFEPMFARIELPWATRLLLGVSALLTAHWMWVLLSATAIVSVGVWLLRDETVRRKMAEMHLRMPFSGALVSSLAVARFARILGTMLANGIPMLSAMRISRESTGHPVLAEAIDEAADAVRAGEPLAEPLAASGMIGNDVIEMIAVGEAANNLPEVLITISETIEKRIDRMLTLLLRLMEPALLLCLAAVVVFIFIALFLPMLRMSTAIGR